MSVAECAWRSFGGSGPAVWAAAVEPVSWLALAREMQARGARLLAMWGADAERDRSSVRAAFLTREGLHVADTAVHATQPLDSIGEIFPAAARMERAMADLVGVTLCTLDARPWLRHASWPSEFHPLRRDAAEPQRSSRQPDAYPFVRVAGDGVHEIPVGPVHAGIIEPGHFRFSVVGEKVLRLEERLGYVHKGIERRFLDMRMLDGHRLAARVSGDSAVAFSWAYCRAIEAMAGIEVPDRAMWLRGIALELERLANHLGDLGALGNDAGFAFGLAQFSRLKEDLVRAVQTAFGQRYLMSFVAPGGVSVDAHEQGLRELAQCLRRIDGEIRALRRIYEDHPGLHDRFDGAGRVEPALAARLGLTGLAGRASGQAFDARVDHPFGPYLAVPVSIATNTRGDVRARVSVRFDEALDTIRVVTSWLEAPPGGATQAPVPVPADGAVGYGLIEGWRGPVLVAIDAGPAGSIRRCHPHDPSWHNWPVLEHAVIGNIVPDFPLINKSFNLSYSGHDL